MACRSVSTGPVSGQIEAQLPLTERLITHLEEHRHRQYEGTFVAYLGFHGTVAWLSATGNTTPPDARMENHPIDLQFGLFSILAPFWNTRIEDLSVQLAASQWVDRVLPPLGYSSLRMIEITLPMANALLPEVLTRITSREIVPSSWILSPFSHCMTGPEHRSPLLHVCVSSTRTECSWSWHRYDFS
jgi:hypothetical protein